MLATSLKLVQYLQENKLTFREAEIATMVTRGFSNNEIAGMTFITEKTVKMHLTSVYKKMKVVSRAQLIVKLLPYTFIEEEGQG